MKAEPFKPGAYIIRLTLELFTVIKEPVFEEVLISEAVNHGTLIDSSIEQVFEK
jgi:hypothetical protein